MIQVFVATGIVFSANIWMERYKIIGHEKVETDNVLSVVITGGNLFYLAMQIPFPATCNANRNTHEL